MPGAGPVRRSGRIRRRRTNLMSASGCVGLQRADVGRGGGEADSFEGVAKFVPTAGESFL